MLLSQLEKACTTCKQVKPLTDFFKQRASKDGLTSQCKACVLKHQKEFYQKNRQRINEYNRDNHRRIRYGILPDVYREKFEVQKGLCPICGKPLPVYHFTHVDHDHNNGKVRALLCCACNAGLGCFHDDPTLIGKAIEYLEANGEYGESI